MRSFLFLLVIILAQSTFGQVPCYRWQHLGPKTVPQGNVGPGQYTANGIGWMESLAVHQGKKHTTIYSGSNVGGLYKSTNMGKTWKYCLKTDRMVGVWDIVVDNSDPKKLWVATGTNTWDDDWGYGVLHSENGGKSWVPTGLSFKPNAREVVYALERSKIDPQVFYACTETDIYKSMDATKTWTKVLDHPKRSRVTFRSLLIHKESSNQVVASGAGVFISKDGGETWEEKSKQFTFQAKNNGRDSLPTRYAITVNPYNNNQVLVLYSYRRINYIDRSDNFGETWYNVHTSRDFDRVDLNHAEIAWHPVDTNVVLVGSVRMYMSGNRGQHFDLISEPKLDKPRFMHDDIRALEITNDGTIWVGHDGGVSISTDMGLTWQDISGEGLTTTQFYDIDEQDGRILGGCQDLSSMLYSDKQWYQTSNIYGDGGMNLMLDSIAFVMQNGMRVMKGDLTLSQWKTLYVPFDPNRFKYPFEFGPTRDTTLWAADHDLWCLRNYKDRSWINLTRNIPKGYTKIAAINTADPDSNVVYLAKDQPLWTGDSSALKGKFYKGRKMGDLDYAWTDITPNLPILAWREIRSIAVNPQNKNDVSVALYVFDANEERQRVYRSTDGGQTWFNYSDGLPILQGLKVMYTPNGQGMFLATDHGIYFRANTMGEWARLGKKFNNGHCIDMEYNADERKLYVATFGNGVWVLRLSKRWKRRGFLD